MWILSPTGASARGERECLECVSLGDDGDLRGPVPRLYPGLTRHAGRMSERRAHVEFEEQGWLRPLGKFTLIKVGPDQRARQGIDASISRRRLRRVRPAELLTYPAGSHDNPQESDRDTLLLRVADMVILMTMSTFTSLAEAKSHLSELVARVKTEHERITVTVHGRPAAVLLAVDDLEAMEETIAVLSDSEAMRALAEADAELARGEGEDLDTLDAAMRVRRATA